jgi:hypothetical protein
VAAHPWLGENGLSVAAESPFSMVVAALRRCFFQ